MTHPSFSHDSDALARDYERVSADRQFETGKQLAARIGIGAGERVLDVGCGTGLLAEHIASLVGPAGRVLGVDPLPARIELARRRAGANLSFEVGDAADLSALDAAGFDVVVLNAVFHWLADKTGPLAEFARVLRPGGRLGLTTRPPGERTPLQQIRAEVLAEPPFEAHARRRSEVLYRVGPDEMRALLEAAGFGAIEVELRPVEQVFADAEAAIRYSEASTFGNFLGPLPPELRDRAREEIRRRLDRTAAGGPVVRKGTRMTAIAVKQ